MNAQKPLTPGQILAGGRLACIKKGPHYTPVAGRLVTQEDRTLVLPSGTPTVAVTPRGRFLWHPDAVVAWFKEQGSGAAVAGAWAHEVLHFALLHHDRALRAGVSQAATEEGAEDRHIWNLACDASINEMLRAGGWVLPKMGVFPEALGLPSGNTAEANYALLKQRRAQAPKQGKGQQGGAQGKGSTPSPAGDPSGGSPGGAQGAQPGKKGSTPSGGGKGNQGGDQGGFAAGHCGGCAGNPHPNEPAEGNVHDVTPSELEGLRRQMAQAIQAALAQSNRQQGDIPGELQVLLDTLKPPRVRWQTKLQRATRRAVAHRAGLQDYTHQKPARRQWGVGVGVGRPLLPAMHAPVPQIVFAMDTSGSVGEEELRTAASETAGILRAANAPVTFMACDVALHVVAQVQSPRELADKAKGRGGTSFRPVFEHLRKKRFQGIVIYATDGHGDAPEEPPRGVHTIWLLIGKGARVPAPWGEVIAIDDLEEGPAREVRAA